jgi:hypothetical protein
LLTFIARTSSVSSTIVHWAPGGLKTDVRYHISGEDGPAKAGKVDNRTFGVMSTYNLGAHSLGARLHATERRHGDALHRRLRNRWWSAKAP